MFVRAMRYGAPGLCLLSGALALGACSDPKLSTDLRPAGPPDVLTVLVSDDPGGFDELPTYCKLNDDKRPGFVAVFGGDVCPTDDLNTAVPEVDTANPLNPYIRIQFDELLDPSFEVLTELLDPDTMAPLGQYSGSIKASKPVTLTCGGTAVPYDGFYNPSGNSVTWPLGPSIVIIPDDPTSIATGSSCSVTIDPMVVKDKDGNGAVDVTPFTFKVAGLEFQGSDPEAADMPDDAATIAPDSPVSLLFNGFVDAASLLPSEVSIEKVTDCTATTGTAQPAVIGSGGDGVIVLGTTGTPDAPEFAPSSAYLIKFTAGANVTDLAGGTLALPATFALCFNTDAS